MTPTIKLSRRARALLTENERLQKEGECFFDESEKQTFRSDYRRYLDASARFVRESKLLRAQKERNDQAIDGWAADLKRFQEESNKYISDVTSYNSRLQQPPETGRFSMDENAKKAGWLSPNGKAP